VNNSALRWPSLCYAAAYSDGRRADGQFGFANGQHILDLLVRLNREEKATLVLVTHDRTLAAHSRPNLNAARWIDILSDEMVTSRVNS
jgi:hypothetical protein